MKPQRFETGQAVTLRARIKKVTQSQSGDWPLPKVGEIYHVRHYVPDVSFGSDEWYIALKEFPSEFSYNEKAFDPVILTTSDIHKLYEESISIKETV